MRSMDLCPACGTGYMIVYKTRTHKTGRRRVRYLACDVCNHHGKEIVEAIPGQVLRRRRDCTSMVQTTAETAQ